MIVLATASVAFHPYHLPRHHGDEAADSDLEAGVEQAPKSPGGETILLIDDEAGLRRVHISNVAGYANVPVHASR